MKRIFLLAVIIAALFAASCGQKATPGFQKEDLYLNVDGTEYRLNVNVESVIAALGPDYDYSEAISCDYDGLDKTFSYDIAEFYTYPLPEGDLVSEIYTENQAVSTSKGITVGASKAEVISAYGENCEDTGFQLVYKLPASGGSTDGGSLCFDMENGAVKAIYITARTF